MGGLGWKALEESKLFTLRRVNLLFVFPPFSVFSKRFVALDSASLGSGHYGNDSIPQEFRRVLGREEFGHVINEWGKQ